MDKPTREFECKYAELEGDHDAKARDKGRDWKEPIHRVDISHDKDNCRRNLRGKGYYRQKADKEAYEPRKYAYEKSRYHTWKRLRVLCQMYVATAIHSAAAISVCITSQTPSGMKWVIVLVENISTSGNTFPMPVVEPIPKS